MKPEIEVKLVFAEDPTFEGGSSHSAMATLTNPTTKAFTYTTELYLGIVKVATSGPMTIPIPAGGSVSMSYPIVMPIAEGTYDVYLDVWVGVELIAHYKATESVTIEVGPAINVGPIIWV